LCQNEEKHVSGAVDERTDKETGKQKTKIEGKETMEQGILNKHKNRHKPYLNTRLKLDLGRD
jgi:hypothetical protein